eukprot:290912-Rhodomonas_salina.1
MSSTSYPAFSLSRYAFATQCGTFALRCVVLTWAMMPRRCGTDIGYAATKMRCPLPISLRARCALCHTELAYGAMGCAMWGTELGYGGMGCSGVRSGIVVRNVWCME